LVLTAQSARERAAVGPASPHGEAGRDRGPGPGKEIPLVLDGAARDRLLTVAPPVMDRPLAAADGTSLGSWCCRRISTPSSCRPRALSSSRPSACGRWPTRRWPTAAASTTPPRSARPWNRTASPWRASPRWSAATPCSAGGLDPNPPKRSAGFVM